MTVLNYIKRQRDKVIERHMGETYFNCGGETVQVPARSAYDILREIDAMQGLNVKERLYAREAELV